MFFTFSANRQSRRKEVLVNIDPFSTGGEPLYKDTFDSSIRGAIIVGPWKLITGVREYSPFFLNPEPFISFRLSFVHQ